MKAASNDTDVTSGLIRILLVDDHASFRQALALAIEHDSGAKVVAQAGSVAEAESIIPVEHDVAVVDLGLPDGDGREVVRKILAESPGSKVLVLTASLAPEDAALAVEAGASGVVGKGVGLDEILSALEALISGKDLHSDGEMLEMMRLAGETRDRERAVRSVFERLTPREMDVLEALAEGLDRREIAGKLSISLHTEHTHVANILTKLGVHSRLEAVVLAIRFGIGASRAPRR